MRARSRVRLVFAAVVVAALTLVLAGGAADSFPVRLVSQTASTVTLGWDPQPGAGGYRFYRDGVAVSRTFDPARTQVTFGAGSVGYRVEVLLVTAGPSGVYPPAVPPPPPPPPPPPGSLTVAPGDSWDAAYKAARPGQTIVVKTGTHPAQELLRDPGKDGATGRVVFQGEPGAIVAGFSTGRSGGSGNTRGADHFELRDLDIRGALRLLLANDVQVHNVGDGNATPSSSRNSFVISSSTNVLVKGGEYGPWVNGVNHINRCGSNPVCPPAGNIVLDSVVLHDFLIDNPAPHSECLMIWGTDTAGVTIRNSILRNCTDFSVLVKAPGASNIVLQDSWFDIPMPGDVATTSCNPGCRRGGSSIRYSGATTLYPGSAVRGSVVNGGIAVDCGCVPRENNRAGAIPEWPPTGGSAG